MLSALTPCVGEFEYYVVRGGGVPMVSSAANPNVLRVKPRDAVIDMTNVMNWINTAAPDN